MDSLSMAERFQNIQAAFRNMFPGQWNEVPAIGQPMLTYTNWLAANTELGSLTAAPDFSRHPNLPEYWTTTPLPVGMLEQAWRLERTRRNQQLVREANQRQIHQQYWPVPTHPMPIMMMVPCVMVPPQPMQVPHLPTFGYTQQAAPRATRPQAPRPSRRILPQRRD